ncbi:hypothetical protein B0H11DRAFT_2197687 [Mycena galericulata]|nr:hypothetical protein B0H11DRAFT_2197687 [Mycena galericulata]
MSTRHQFRRRKEKDGRMGHTKEMSDDEKSKLNTYGVKVSRAGVKGGRDLDPYPKRSMVSMSVATCLRYVLERTRKSNNRWMKFAGGGSGFEERCEVESGILGLGENGSGGEMRGGTTRVMGGTCGGSDPEMRFGLDMRRGCMMAVGGACERFKRRVGRDEARHEGCDEEGAVEIEDAPPLHQGAVSSEAANRRTKRGGNSGRIWPDAWKQDRSSVGKNGDQDGAYPVPLHTKQRRERFPQGDDEWGEGI